MIDPSIEGRRRAAIRDFKRLMICLIVAGVGMVAAALFYLSRHGPLTPMLVITTTLGVFVSVVLGGGLMAAGFFSSTSGVDDDVAAAMVELPTAPLDKQDQERAKATS